MHRGIRTCRLKVSNLTTILYEPILCIQADFQNCRFLNAKMITKSQIEISKQEIFAIFITTKRSAENTEAQCRRLL